MGGDSCLFTLSLSYVDCALSWLAYVKCHVTRHTLWLAATTSPHEYFPSCSIWLQFCRTF